MKKVIVFDLDGVLFDSTKMVLQFFLDSYPTMTKERMDHMLTGNFRDEVERFKLEDPGIDETPEQRKQRNLEYTKNKASAPLYPGAKELLQKLHAQGHILAINTSAIERNCVPLLEQNGIRNLFDVIMTGEIANSKTIKLNMIAEKYKVSPKDMVFVTDTVGDVKESFEAGVPTAVVTYGAHGPEFFSDTVYTNIIGMAHSVKELEHILS